MLRNMCMWMFAQNCPKRKNFFMDTQFLLAPISVKPIVLLRSNGKFVHEENYICHQQMFSILESIPTFPISLGRGSYIDIGFRL